MRLFILMAELKLKFLFGGLIFKRNPWELGWCILQGNQKLRSPTEVYQRESGDGFLKPSVWQGAPLAMTENFSFCMMKTIKTVNMIC